MRSSCIPVLGCSHWQGTGQRRSQAARLYLSLHVTENRNTANNTANEQLVLVLASESRSAECSQWFCYQEREQAEPKIQGNFVHLDTFVLLLWILGFLLLLYKMFSTFTDHWCPLENSLIITCACHSSSISNKQTLLGEVSLRLWCLAKAS